MDASTEDSKGHAGVTCSKELSHGDEFVKDRLKAQVYSKRKHT